LPGSARRLLAFRREAHYGRSTLGTGWALEVCSSGVLVGHIQFGAQNLFRYYEGAENEFTALLSDADLEALGLQVEDYHRRR
jgi:hypothetical protein